MCTNTNGVPLSLFLLYFLDRFFLTRFVDDGCWSIIKQAFSFSSLPPSIFLLYLSCLEEELVRSELRKILLAAIGESVYMAGTVGRMPLASGIARSQSVAHLLSKWGHF